MRIGLTIVGSLSGLLLGACSGGGSTDSSASREPAAPTTPFVEVAAAAGISYRVGYTRPSFVRRNLGALLTSQVLYMTIGGAAAGDCDNDGDVDLFITYGNTGGPDGGGGPNRLYLNRLVESGHGLKFEDRAAAAGVANTRPDGNNDRHSGPAFADMDGDGDLDLFVGGVHGDPSKIYRNTGGCKFEDVTAQSPDIVNMRASQTISASFGDYDLDGDLDMFLTHWGTLDSLYGTPPTSETDHLWRNDSDASSIRFVNVSRESGISKLTRLTRASDFHGQPQIGDFTFTGTFAHLDGDPWPDLLIAADFGTTQIALNNGNATFRNLDNPALRAAQFGMGSALGDVDNDGDLDWFVTSILGPGDARVQLTPWGNRFYSNNGGASLIVDATERAGVANGSFGWAACFLDIDNDADLDIFHTNGYPVTFLTPKDDYRSDASRAFVRDESGKYTDRAEALGLAGRASGRGVVCADFDNDGDTDILELTEAAGNSARLWDNRTAAAGRHFLRVKLTGLPPNTAAAGARVFARIGNVEQMREVRIGNNYISQNPTVQIFGLDSSATVDELRVEWPARNSGAGLVQPPPTILRGVAAGEPGETLSIKQPEPPGA